eukprot:gene8087-762_t
MDATFMANAFTFAYGIDVTNPCTAITTVWQFFLDKEMFEQNAITGELLKELQRSSTFDRNECRQCYNRSSSNSAAINDGKPNTTQQAQMNRAQSCINNPHVQNSLYECLCCIGLKDESSQLEQAMSTRLNLKSSSQPLRSERHTFRENINSHTSENEIVYNFTASDRKSQPSIEHQDKYIMQQESSSYNLQSENQLKSLQLSVCLQILECGNFLELLRIFAKIYPAFPLIHRGPIPIHLQCELDIIEVPKDVEIEPWYFSKHIQVNAQFIGHVGLQYDLWSTACLIVQA